MARSPACARTERADDLAFAAAQLEQAHWLKRVVGQTARQARGSLDGLPLA